MTDGVQEMSLKGMPVYSSRDVMNLRARLGALALEDARFINFFVTSRNVARELNMSPTYVSTGSTLEDLLST